MKPIDEKVAFLGLDPVDIRVIEDELYNLRNSVQRFKRHMTHKYFLEDRNTIKLVVYWDDKEVEVFRFVNKGVVLNG